MKQNWDSRTGFDRYDWAPADVDLEELATRIIEIYDDPTKVPTYALAVWISKYWTLRYPDGGLPDAMEEL